MQQAHYAIQTIKKVARGFDAVYQLADGRIATAELRNNYPSWNRIQKVGQNDPQTILIGANNHNLLYIQTMDWEILEVRLRPNP